MKYYCDNWVILTLQKFFLCFVVLGFGGCSKESVPDDVASFRHGSPRPECRYQVDPNRTAYFEKPVLLSDEWSEPIMVSAPLTDKCPNDAVEISRDGQTIYFFWSPTVGGTYEELLHIHTGTYFADRIGDNPGQFNNPRFYDLQKGTEGSSVDGSLSFTPGGDYVYFHSTRIDNTGYQQSPPIDDPMDIYVAPVVNGEPGYAVNPGAPVNSVYLDGEHALSPDGMQLYFTSDRPGGLGGPDIWVTNKTGDGWSDPVNPGAPVNSSHWEGQPGFAANRPDIMYFVSNRDGPSSIYKTAFDGASWSEPVMVITGYVGEPSLTGDGSIMYFVHVLIDDDGAFGSNIWYVQRLRK